MLGALLLIPAKHETKPRHAMLPWLRLFALFSFLDGGGGITCKWNIPRRAPRLERLVAIGRWADVTRFYCGDPRGNIVAENGQDGSCGHNLISVVVFALESMYLVLVT